MRRMRFPTSAASSRFTMGIEGPTENIGRIISERLEFPSRGVGLNYNPQCQEDVYMVLYPISEAVVEIHIFCWFDPYFELSLS